MKYYIKEWFDRPDRLNTAGSKARRDAEEIASREGYAPFEIAVAKSPNPADSIIVKLRRHREVYRQWKRFSRQLCMKDSVLIQLPLMNNSIFLKKILKEMKKKGIVTVGLVHDLEVLRLRGKEKASLKSRVRALMEERNIIWQCGKVIVHNDRMKKYLLQRGMDEKRIIDLEIFDYLTKEQGKPAKKAEKTVCIAGNLLPDKAEYLYHIRDEKVLYRLYGVGYEKGTKGNFCYMGCFPPEELPGKLNGAFGLVWDGTSTRTCKGGYGEYLRYNNPHKTSLYLAAGIPVIIWEQAALSDFVLKYGIGMTVASIDEIAGKIDNLSDEEYQSMLKNVEKISFNIRSGFYLTKALRKV